MAIQVNVNPQGLDTLSQNLTQLIAKLDDIANTLSTGGAKQSSSRTRKAKSKEEETPVESSAGAIQQETKKQRSPLERLDATMEKSHTVQMSLTKSLDELNKNLTRVNRGARSGGGGGTDVENVVEPVSDENIPPGGKGKKKKKEPEYTNIMHQRIDEFVKEKFGQESSYTPSSLFKGMALGSIALLNYQSQSYGAYEGFAEAGAMNYSPSDYAEFERIKKQQQISQRTSMSGTLTNFLSTGAIVGLMGLDLTGPIGALISTALMGTVGALAATSQYFIGKSGAEDTQVAQFQSNLDKNSLLLGAAGISKRLDQEPIMGDGYSVSTIDQTLINEGYPVVGSADILLGARRDFTLTKGQLSTPAAMANYVKGINQLGAATGTDDLGKLSFAITQIASMTGKSTDKVMDEFADSFTNYGGNTLANKLQAISIGQTSNIPEKEAENLVGKFQYNEPYLRNIVGRSMLPPLSAAIYYKQLKALGASKDEMTDFVLDAKDRATIAQVYKDKANHTPTQEDAKAQARMYLLQLINPGGDIFATAAHLEKGKGKGDFSQTVQQKDFQQSLMDSLSSMTVTTQNVKADSVYVNYETGKDTGLPKRKIYTVTGTGGVPAPVQPYNLND